MAGRAGVAALKGSTAWAKSGGLLAGGLFLRGPLLVVVVHGFLFCRTEYTDRKLKEIHEKIHNQRGSEFVNNRLFL